MNLPSWRPNLDAPRAPGSDYIRRMFDGMADRYDAFTLLMGWGFERGWRRDCLKALEPGMRVLDLACGTGDLAIDALGRIAGSGEVIGLDFSPRMLEVARQRLSAASSKTSAPWRLIQAAAEELPLIGEAPFDLIVSGFALRNFYQNIRPTLDGVYRSLKPGGRIAFVDVTCPEHPLLKRLWKFYFFTLAGFYGWVLFGPKYPIPYLPESGERFVGQREFAALLQEAGFVDVRTRSLTLGAAAIYTANRP